MFCQVTTSFQHLVPHSFKHVVEKFTKTNAVLILSKTLWCYLILNIFLITCSVIGSFSVLVVSLVRWRHLREQVSQVVCTMYVHTCVMCLCFW